MSPILAALATALALAAVPVLAQSDIRAERVGFAPGAEGAVIEGRITGDEVIDYLVDARAGQRATVVLSSGFPHPFFNLLPPGSTGQAVFVGSSEGDRYEGVLEASGDWTVRVYQMGNARDAGETHAFTLDIRIAAAGGGPAAAPSGWQYAAPEEGGPRRWQVTAAGGLRMHSEPSVAAPVTQTLPGGAILSNLGCAEGPDRVWCDVQPFRGGARGWVAAEFLAPAPGAEGSAAPAGADDSALRAGRGEFDATAPSVPCARGGGPLAAVCELGVARGGGGDATVVVAFPDGFRRALFFAHGEFVSADASEAGGGFDTEWSKDAGGTYRIRVDDELYEFPEAVIFGG